MQKIQYPHTYEQTLIDYLEKTKMAAIRATMKEKTSPDWGIFTSKLGGIPYFPKDISYPVNKEGIPLGFLAQINLSDIFDNPELQIIAEKDPYLKHFPKQGILSFYYDINDDLMGLIYPRNYQPDWEKRGYRVLYFPEIITDETYLSRESYDQLTTLIAQEKIENYGIMPITDSYPLQFSAKETLLPLDIQIFSDPIKTALYDYIAAIEETGDIDEFYDEFYDLLAEHNCGHALSGYPFFAQHDPREEADQQHILLLQIDSLDDLMIGDCGSMQFFISEENLQQQNFNQTFYDWACG